MAPVKLKYEDPHLHYIAITAIIRKGGKYLITKRSPKERAFPNMWTVPGGRIDARDYIKTPKTTDSGWYYEVERTLKREIREEVNLEVSNVMYLLDLTFVRPEGIPTVVLSFYADYKSGKVKLAEDTEFAWVTPKEAKKYDLIAGIYEEIVMAEKLNNGAKFSSVKFKPQKR
ncbi:MAG: NUDIX domain-containing protein [bacterium]|nr:NUDIX domain-containing protein [bacterium]